MVKQIQQRFTQGEFDPKMLGRADIDMYSGGAETIENIIVLPQGGFKRRGGLEHIDTILKQLTFAASPTITVPNGGTSGNLNDRVFSTSSTTTNTIGTTNPYVVAQYDLGTSQSIGVVHMQGLRLTSSGTSSEFFIQASPNGSTWTTIGSALTLTTSEKHYSRRIEASYRYVRLARIGATNLGSNTVFLRDLNIYTDGANSEVRLIPFEFNSDQSYLLAVTDKNIAVYRNGIYQVDIPAVNITNALLSNINWAQSADTLILFHEDMKPQIVQRQNADDYWSIADLAFESIPYFAFTEVSQTGAALGWGSVKPDATSGTTHIDITSGGLNSTYVNQYIEGNGGLARILAVQSATKADIFIEIPFYNTDNITNANYNILTGYEEVWSSSRGYPICGTFHSGRLWIGGSKSRPTTLWGSRSGIYYNFALGSSLDDDGIEATMDTDQLNRIVNIYSGRNLMVFTTGAEFIIPTALNEPITPTNISTVRQSRVGSQDGLRVQEIEGGIFYVQNGGQSIQEFLFSDTQQAYANNIISLLSGHLVDDPQDFCLRRATSLDDGALLALVRGNGKATIATIQRSQLITAFTSHTTDGLFIACGADYSDLYFGVTRNGLNYLERINDDHLLDASVRTTTGLPTATFTGLSHLNGEECRVVADGSVLPRVTPSAGSATISRNAEQYCEIGLWFQPIFKDLPAIYNFTNVGSTLGRLFSINEVVLRLFQTVSIKVNNSPVAFRGFGLSGGGSPLDSPPPSFTGIKRILGFRGWDETAQVTITQEEPAPFTVLAMSKGVMLGG
jgi:hypothetical protein